MTDGRLSRESEEALVQVGSPDASLSRESVEALSQVGPPDARLSRESVEVLISEIILSIEGWGSVPM